MTTAKDILQKLSSMVPSEHHETKEAYRIGDLAREFGLSLRTLRFYEDRGLLSPDRMGSTRLYKPSERDRLKIILLSKRVGFPLVDIEELLRIYDDKAQNPSDISAVLKKFEQQLGVLKEQKSEIERSISDLEVATRQIHELN